MFIEDGNKTWLFTLLLFNILLVPSYTVRQTKAIWNSRCKAVVICNWYYHLKRQFTRLTRQNTRT